MPSYINAKYLIELNGDAGVPIEVALSDFMAGVFKLADESKCIGHGLSITRIEIDDINR